MHPILSRRSATTDVTSASEGGDSDSVNVAVELDDKDSREGRLKEKQFYGTRGGYQSWVKTGAASQFYDINPGQKARWLDERTVSFELYRWDKADL